MTMPVIAGAMERNEFDRNAQALPTMLMPHAVVELFKRADLALYGDARRDFLLRANVDPDRAVHGDAKMTLRRAFEEWFVFDCELDAHGVTPFDIVARYQFDVLGAIDRREYANLRCVSTTQRVSWFRVLDANAVSGKLLLEDLAGEELYEVLDRHISGEIDGVRRGVLVGRIAQSYGAWRLVGSPLRLSRREETDRAHMRFCRLAALRQPQFVDYVRFFYGRNTGRHASYDALDEYERSNGVEGVWAKLSRGCL